jgi:hypothetical protein
MLLGKGSVNEAQGHWRNQFDMPPPTCITVALLCFKLRVDLTVKNMDKELSEDLAVQLTVEVLRQCYRSS